VTFRFPAALWRWPKGNWHFVTLPFDVSDEIDESASSARVGFGSVRVEVTIGATTWSTSVFPDTTAEAFVLPIKRAVRDAEGIDAGDEVNVELRVLA
jgi:hypothetical protein